MVNLAYIRKRKARKIIVAVALGCAAAALVIGAIAMLGQKASPFSVKLANAGVSLTLSEREDEDTSGGKIYLMPYAGETLPSYCCYTETLLNNFGDEVIDDWRSESSFNYDDKDVKTAIRYFKYTFYVTNNGSVETDYDLELTLNTPINYAKNRYGLDDVLRVRFYENTDLTKHDYKTYAKSSRTENIDPETGKPTNKEFVGVPGESELAEEFLSSKLLLKSHISSLEKGKQVRNTFVIWLEGEDPECVGKEPPVESALVLGVDISAHASQKDS